MTDPNFGITLEEKKEGFPFQNNSKMYIVLISGTVSE